MRIIDPTNFQPLLLHGGKNKIIRAVIFLACSMQRNPRGILGHCATADVNDSRRQLVVRRGRLKPLLLIAGGARRQEATQDRQQKFGASVFLQRGKGSTEQLLHVGDGAWRGLTDVIRRGC